MTEDRLVELIFRQFSGELTPKELGELTAWAEQDKINRQFLERLSKEGIIEREFGLWTYIDPSKGYEAWRSYIRMHWRSKVFRLTGWFAAATVLVVMAITTLVKPSKRTAGPAPNLVKAISIVPPGRTAATLTLSNGHRILLDSVAEGDVIMEGNTRLLKPDSGTLSYVSGRGGQEDVSSYNVLTTPRAGQYQLTLSDGTRVWLNNVTSLRYPTSFQGEERVVELTGEAYFEIAKDPVKPFIVKANSETVEVLGTSFNVMAYSDERNSQTTLVNGAVRVKYGNDMVILKPHEQAQIVYDKGLDVIKHAPVEDIVAWKNGFFYFGRASFPAVMRQLARWYDVDIIYEGKVPDIEFGGKIDRGLPLDELLKYLDRNQVHFRLKGRKLLVLSN